MSCATCAFWHRIGKEALIHPDDAIGHCRRHAPRISDHVLRRAEVMEGIANVDGVEPSFDVVQCASIWPVTLGALSCGEHFAGGDA